jgi:hypothetical protein
MRFNLAFEKEVKKFDLLSKTYKISGFPVELKREHEEDEKKQTLTTLQNSSIHKFFVIISDNLNDLGIDFCYTGLTGIDLSVRYTPNIVKNFFWRPIQIALFDIVSTTQLDTKKINDISDVIIKFFGERSVVVEFPNKDRLNKK